MASMLSGSFIRTILRKVHDCSNVIQLREYLNRYRNYVFTREIQEVFKERIEFFMERASTDRFTLEICEDLMDDLLLEIQISNVCGKQNLVKPHAKVSQKTKQIDVVFLDPDSDVDCPFERELITEVFEMTNGNKLDICRILDLSNEQLNKKISQYKLKPRLNEIRRNYRSGS